METSSTDCNEFIKPPAWPHNNSLFLCGFMCKEVTECACKKRYPVADLISPFLGFFGAQLFCWVAKIVRQTDAGTLSKKVQMQWAWGISDTLSQVSVSCEKPSSTFTLSRHRQNMQESSGISGTEPCSCVSVATPLLQHIQAAQEPVCWRQPRAALPGIFCEAIRNCPPGNAVRSNGLTLYTSTSRLLSLQAIVHIQSKLPILVPVWYFIPFTWQLPLLTQRSFIC